MEIPIAGYVHQATHRKSRKPRKLMPSRQIEPNVNGLIEPQFGRVQPELCEAES